MDKCRKIHKGAGKQPTQTSATITALWSGTDLHAQRLTQAHRETLSVLFTLRTSSKTCSASAGGEALCCVRGRAGNPPVDGVCEGIPGG